MFFLLWDALGQAAELVAGALGFAPQFLVPFAIHIFGGTCQSPASAVGDGQHHVQVAQQFLGRGGGRRRFDLPLRFQEQLGLLQDPLADRSGSVPPGGI
jgi:hypothetical protein